MKRSNEGKHPAPRGNAWGFEANGERAKELAGYQRDLWARANRLRNELEVAKTRDDAVIAAATYLGRVQETALATGLVFRPIMSAALDYLVTLTMSEKFLRDAVKLQQTLARVQRASRPITGYNDNDLQTT